MGFNDGFSIQGVPFITGSDGQVLTWNDTIKQWVAADPTGGGGGAGTVETSGNITGSGAPSNKVRLKDDISLTSVTASYFSGSFIGDGAGLLNVPAGIQSIEFDRVVYVNSGSTGTSGSFDDPFGTVSDAVNYINSTYTSGESVLINIGPGTYTSPGVITRRNLYFKGLSSKYEQRAVTFAGAVEISCSYVAGRMFSDVVGFEGIFFNGGVSSATFKVSTNSYTTYLKDCYLAASSGQNALLMTSDLTTTFGNGARLSAKDCYFWRASGDSDLIVVNGGSCKFDSIEMGYSGAGTASAIKQTGGVIQVDRLLVDVATNTAAISSSVALSPPRYTPNLFLTNVSLLSSGSTNAIINNGSLFIANSYLGNNINTNPTIAGSGVVSYGSLTSLGQLPIVINGIFKLPLAETFGGVTVNNISASSGVTGSFVGNGAGLTDILTSSISNFTNSVRSLFTGSGIITYNSSSGEISAPTAMTGVLTSGNITGSGVNGDAVRTIDNPTFTSISASSNAYVAGNLYVVGTASVGMLETVSQSSLQIGDKYITVLSGADNHGAANGSGILWGSGSSDPTKGPEGSIAFALYKTSSAGQYPGEYIEMFPGVLVSGSLTASSTISSSAGFYGDGSGLTGVVASSFQGIGNYATITGSNIFQQSQTITGSLFVQNVVSASQFTGSFSGSFSGNSTTADTANNALNLGGIPAANYALTGSPNIFTGNQTVTGSVLISSNVSASQVTGSFSGNGANVTNLTGSNWNGGTSSFFANVRDAFIFDSSLTVGSTINGRYPITASGGTGGSSAGSVLEFTASSTGSYGTLTAGTIVGVSGAFIRAADNNDSLSSNIIGVISGTVGATFNIVIAGEVSASISASLPVPLGGTPVYLSDTPGRFGTYDGISVNRNIVQIGIVSPRDNKIILQPRIFGVKA